MSQPYQWNAGKPSDGDRPVWRRNPPSVPTTPAPRRPHSDEEKLEAAAALGAFDELGPDYHDAVVESFLARMDAMQERRNPPMALPPPSPRDIRRANKGGSNIALVVVCLALSIPLTAIAGGIAGFFGILACWVGIVCVAFVLGRFRNN